MPSLLGYVEQRGSLPLRLTFSLAALMAFYQGTEIRDKALTGHREEQEYRILDDADVLEFFRDHCQGDIREYVTAFLGNTAFWGQDLNSVKGLTEAVAGHLGQIREKGMREALCRIS